MANKARKAKKIRGRNILDVLPHVTLEDILAFVNNRKYESFFLQTPREFPDGSREYLTREGGKAYGELVSLIYACGRRTGINVEELVEELDSIATEPV